MTNYNKIQNKIIKKIIKMINIQKAIKMNRIKQISFNKTNL